MGPPPLPDAAVPPGQVLPAVGASPRDPTALSPDRQESRLLHLCSEGFVDRCEDLSSKCGFLSPKFALRLSADSLNKPPRLCPGPCSPAPRPQPQSSLLGSKVRARAAPQAEDGVSLAEPRLRTYKINLGFFQVPALHLSKQINLIQGRERNWESVRTGMCSESGSVLRGSPRAPTLPVPCCRHLTSNRSPGDPTPGAPGRHILTCPPNSSQNAHSSSTHGGPPGKPRAPPTEAVTLRRGVFSPQNAAQQ